MSNSIIEFLNENYDSFKVMGDLEKIIESSEDSIKLESKDPNYDIHLCREGENIYHVVISDYGDSFAYLYAEVPNEIWNKIKKGKVE